MLRRIRQPGQGGREEESPLPIPDPTGINSSTPSSEQDFSKQFSNNIRESLERHLGTIIEETFWERSQTLEWPPWVNQAHDKCPGAPTAQAAQADRMAEHRQNLLDGVADMRTKLLNCFFFLIYIFILLHFLTYIWSLCACKIEKGQKVYTTKQLYSIQNKWSL